jgi:hypothetical protein
VLHETVGASGSALARFAVGDDSGLLTLATEAVGRIVDRAIARGLLARARQRAGPTA